MSDFFKLHHDFFDFIKNEFLIQNLKKDDLSLRFNTNPGRQKFGDLSSNGAFIIAKYIKEKTPLEIAQQITSQFSHPAIDTMHVVNPGFINFILSKRSFQDIAWSMYTSLPDYLKKDDDVFAKRFSVEFVSANPTGPLHLGHGRGGIVGDVLCRILRIYGQAVTSEFYINDVGSQIKKLGICLKIRCQQLQGIEVSIPEEGYHGEYLKNIAQQCLQNYTGKSLLEEENQFFENFAKNALLEQIKQTLSHYNIEFDVWFSEKSLHVSGEIEQALDTLKKNGYLYEKDGAWWFPSTLFGDDKDRVIKKQSGELTYVAADIAYLINKKRRGFNKIVFILGQDHHSYVIRLKSIMQALGYDPDELDVILYQLVTLKESGISLRLSKRAGRIVSLEEIIQEVGTDVARFFYLHRKVDAHLDFDIDLALKKTDENPVFYIQYAYVRTKSILEKAKETFPHFQKNISKYSLSFGKEEELLIKKIATLKEIIHDIASSYQTHLLAYYVIELAQEFHRYYAQNKVIQVDQPERSITRLFVIQLVHKSFAQCFQLLGITTPESM